MTSYLEETTEGKIDVPYRIFVYGVEGTGKSTEVGKAESALFVPTEEGTNRLKVKRTPRLKKFEDAINVADELLTKKHNYKTLIYDTTNGLEKLLHKEMVGKEQRAETVMDTKGGYGKGLMFAEAEFGRLLDKLDELVEKKQMNIILINHATIKDFKDPHADANYQRYTPSLDKKVSDLIKRWADAVFFVAPETIVSEDKKTKKDKAWMSGSSVVYTQARAGYDAKNRFGLPHKLEWDWNVIMDAIDNADPDDSAPVIEQINGLKEKIQDEAFLKIVDETVEKAKGNTAQLRRIVERLETRLQDA